MKISKHLYALAIAGAVSIGQSVAQSSYSVLLSNFDGNGSAYTFITPNVTQIKLDFTLNPGRIHLDLGTG